MKTFKHGFIRLLSVACFLLYGAQASAVLIDLNELDAYPDSNVSISTDGMSATFTENAYYSPVSLEHSGYAMPADSLSLRFDYSLSVGPEDEDYFDFYLGDLVTPQFSTNGSSMSGVVLVDVTPFAGTLLPMVFSLSYGWNDFGLDSILTISHLEIVQSGATVPEPGTLMLMALGLLAIFFNLRRC